MNLDILKNIGLSDGEVKVYTVLLELGEMTAGEIISKTSLKRGDCYNKLYDLNEKGLVEEFQKAGKKTFRLEHPQKIQEYINASLQTILDTKKEMSALLDDITSQYNLVSNKPGVSFYEGKDGLRQIYDDILEEGENFSLVRAKYENIYLKDIVPDVVNNFIKKRVQKDISVKALTTFEKNLLMGPDKDKELLYDRQWVSTEDYSAPVEIDVYADKVALLSFKKELVGVIIQSPQIAQAIKQLFDLARIGAKVKFQENLSNKPKD